MKILVAALVGASTLGLLGSRPAAAAELPYCVTMGDGYIDCSYATLRQCVVTARGVGQCVSNPRYGFRFHGWGPFDYEREDSPPPRRR